MATRASERRINIPKCAGKEFLSQRRLGFVLVVAVLALVLHYSSGHTALIIGGGCDAC